MSTDNLEIVVVYTVPFCFDTLEIDRACVSFWHCEDISNWSKCINAIKLNSSRCWLRVRRGMQMDHEYQRRMALVWLFWINEWHLFNAKTGQSNGQVAEIPMELNDVWVCVCVSPVYCENLFSKKQWTKWIMYWPAIVNHFQLFFFFVLFMSEFLYYCLPYAYALCI